MPRKRTATTPAAQPQAAQPPAVQLSRPVVLDMSKLQIPDLKLIIQLDYLVPLAAAGAVGEAELMQHVPAMIDMLDHVVVGGMAGRPATELWAVLGEVKAQMNSAGNPKN